MTPLLAVCLVLLVVSGAGLVVLVLLHSGKGTGINEMIASSLYSATTGTRVVEENLDKLTVGFAIVFALCALALMIIYPTGSIAG